MRLLFDQNLASRLVRSLADLYPDSVHVRDVGLASADDGRLPTEGDLDQTRKLLDDDHRAHASRPSR